MAKKFQCEIFSADSRQVYKELNIGVAKPTHYELSQANHHFINHISIHQEYNVGTYESQMMASLNQYFQTHNIAILTGGTGLYIQAVINGIDRFPDIPLEIRENISKQLISNGLKYLQNLLQDKDPIYYNSIDINNPRRVTRALEVIDATGKPFSSFLINKRKKRNFDVLGYLLVRDRKNLYHRVNLRVDNMMKQGLLEEVEALYPLRHLKALQTVGYSELFSYFDGNIDLYEAIELIKRNTRRYAKRQMTWFRKYGQWKKFQLD